MRQTSQPPKMRLPTRKRQIGKALLRPPGSAFGSGSSLIHGAAARGESGAVRAGSLLRVSELALAADKTNVITALIGVAAMVAGSCGAVSSEASATMMAWSSVAVRRIQHVVSKSKYTSKHRTRPRTESMRLLFSSEVSCGA
jgi:hypothetical protein